MDLGFGLTRLRAMDYKKRIPVGSKTISRFRVCSKSEQGNFKILYENNGFLTYNINMEELQ